MSGHHPHADHNDPFQKKVAVCLAAYAALLAFTTMLTNEARTASILLASESANQWSFFQSKSTKGVVTRAELELLDQLAPRERADAGTPGGTTLAEASGHGTEKSDAPAPASEHGEHAAAGGEHHGEAAAPIEVASDPAELRARLTADISRYETEKQDIQKIAQEKAELGHHQQHREHLFEYAATISELAIVIAGIALLMQSNAAWIVSLLFAAGSIVLTGFTALN